MKRRHANLIQKSIAVSALLLNLLIPVDARVGAPVSFGLASGDTLRRGEPLTVLAVIEAAADFPYVRYEVKPSSEWQVLDGQSQWGGPLQKGQRIELYFKAIPLSDAPEPLAAHLVISGQEEKIAMLDPARLGGRFPERAMADPADKAGKGAARSAEEAIQVQFEPGVALPEPLAATEPIILGQPAAAPEPAAKKRPARAASVAVTGRFTYLDDAGARRGVRNAAVEVLNKNGFPIPDEVCGRGITDGNGNFSIGGNCGDLFDGPDVFARIVLNNSVVEVRPVDLFAGTYTFSSNTVQNTAGGAINFGVITITSNRGAFHTHNIVMRAQQFMANQGESMSKVTVLWPAAIPVSFYTPVLNTLTLESAVPFVRETTVYHEYAHHILHTKAETPIPDYNNGICDDGNPGHCLFSPERGDIAWTEGFPDFFGFFMFNEHVGDGYGTAPFDLETVQDQFNFPGQEDHTEGIVAAILWDLVDSENDDENDDGPGRRDRINLAFSDIWNVVRNFDPSGNLLHNHPTNIHEIWSGLRQFNLGSINLISEAYREHGIVKPQPDLEVTNVQTPPTQLARGASFTISSTVHNDGNERANNSSLLRFALVRAGGLPVIVQTRTVGQNLLAGANSTAVSTITVPANIQAGTYQIRACADSSGVVPESDESNNCRSATGSIVVTQ